MTALDLLYARRRRESLAQSAQLEQFAYHGTSKSNLRAIRAVGLLPQVGDNTEDAEGKDVEAKVCLTYDHKTAKKYAGKDGVVLAVDLDHPHLDGTVPQDDEFTSKSVTVNQRIHPDAITVKPVEGRLLSCARLSEAYALDPQASRHFTGLDETSAHELATHHGFRESHKVEGQYGTVVRYFHQNGDNLIVTDLPENLKDRGTPWETKWEYHTRDGVKSSGQNVESLGQYLKMIHPRSQHGS